MRLLGLLLCLGLMMGVSALARLDLGHGAPDEPGGPAMLALGFLLLAAYLSGKVAKSVKLPKITGYLAIGAIVGPQVLGLVTYEMKGDLVWIKNMAVALIALNAGGEMNFAKLREMLREILILFAAKVSFALLFIVGALWFILPHLDAIPTDQAGVSLAVIVVVGVVALANSPMVAIALINETRSAGPMSKRVLLLAIFIDIFLIVAFSVALEVGRVLTSDASLDAAQFANLIFVKIGGSVLLGLAIGWVMGLYVKRFGGELPIVILAACLFIAILGEQLHLKPLLIALAAGTYVENSGGGAGHKVIEAIKATSLPVYCLFFALAGVDLNLKDLIALGPAVGAIALARAAGIFCGCRVGAILAGSEESVKTYLWSGLVSQAGLALAFASLVSQAFEWGPPVATLLIALVVVNEVFGPIIFSWALQKSGEAGQAEQ